MLFEQTILVNQKGEAAIKGFNPWVFRGMCHEQTPMKADWVTVRDMKNQFLAYGFFNPSSELSLRLYSFDESSKPDIDWFKHKIDLALRLRGKQKCCRLINSEGDGLSGLTVDLYDFVLSISITSLSVFEYYEVIKNYLCTCTGVSKIILKIPQEFCEKEGISSKIIQENFEPLLFNVDGVLYRVDFTKSQKKGLFLDQILNHLHAAKYADQKRVLDLFCYHGGFALQCKKAGAREVVAVDESHQAIVQAKENATLNALDIQCKQGQALSELQSLSVGQYDMIILDPPKLVPNIKSKERGLKMYHLLNLEALKKLKEGGVLVTSSCSGLVHMGEWLDLIRACARRAKKTVQVLESHRAAFDHPINIHCPSTEYLKCVILRVMT